MEWLAEILPDGVWDSRLAWSVLIVIGVGIMRGFTGFGSAMALAVTLVHFYPPAQMIAMIMLLDICTGLQLSWGVRRQADWKLTGFIALCALVVMPFGVLILEAVSPDAIARAVAFIVLGFVIMMIFGWGYRGPRPWPLSGLVGGLSGLMISTTSMGGPPVLVYLLSGGEAARVHRANMIIYLLLVDVMMLAILIFKGYVGAAVLWRVALLIPIYVGANALGARFFSEAHEQLYRRIALGSLLVIALYGLLA